MSKYLNSKQTDKWWSRFSITDNKRLSFSDSRWVSTNIQNTRHLASASKQLRIDYKSLHNDVKEKYGLADVVWSCGWRGTHQLACLRRLEQLLNSEQQYQQLVKGKLLISWLYGYAYLTMFHKQIPNIVSTCNKTCENSLMVSCMLDHTYTCTFNVTS